MPLPVTNRFRAPIVVGPNGALNYPLYVARGTLNPATGADQATGITLPPGARIVMVVSLGGSTGGSSPTVDLGVAGTLDGIADELPANLYTVATTHLGATANTILTAQTVIRGRVGASAATGGTTSFLLFYEFMPGYYEPSAE